MVDFVGKPESIRAFLHTNFLDDIDYILLLPDDDTRFNARLRTAFSAKLGCCRGLIVEGEQVDSLLSLYSIYAFTDKLIVGSFNKPHGRKLCNLMETGIATEDELINDVILGAM